MLAQSQLTWTSTSFFGAHREGRYLVNLCKYAGVNLEEWYRLDPAVQAVYTGAYEEEVREWKSKLRLKG